MIASDKRKLADRIELALQFDGGISLDANDLQLIVAALRGEAVDRHGDKFQLPEHCGGEPFAELKPSATWCYHNPIAASDEIERLRSALETCRELRAYDKADVVAEREACAILCEEQGGFFEGKRLATAIRARSGEPLRERTVVGIEYERCEHGLYPASCSECHSGKKY